MPSSDINSGALVTSNIKVNGSTIPDEYQVYSILVEHSVNRIGRATITVLDGDAGGESFPASTSTLFVPGNEISIEAGYDSDNQLIFSGIITGQTLRVDDKIGTSIDVKCNNEAVKMTVGRNSASFTNMTDSAVMESIIASHGLAAEVDNTNINLPIMQQYYVSDWHFILNRAEMNGLLVKTDNGKVSVFSPVSDTSPVMTIGYGYNLYKFNADLESLTQLNQVTASAWDYKTQEIISGQASPNISGPGNLSSKTLSKVVSPEDFELQSTAALEDENLTGWAKARMLKSELSKIVGDVEFQGSSLVKPGKYISLEGLGDRFNGSHLVSSVVHDIKDGDWLTRAGIGLTTDWFIQAQDFTESLSADLIPKMPGLFNSTVKQIHDDPDGQFRILIDLPLFDPSGEGIWARLTNFYSSNGAGAFFLPEVGDEVIVGFLNSDPGFPVILGSLYSSVIKPSSELVPNEENSLKAIVSKSGLRVVFDDKNKVMSLITPDQNQIILDDNDGRVTIQDQNNNSIVMSAYGISINSPQSISITAGRNIDISGSTGVTVSAAQGDVNTSAMNINENADAQYSAEAGATASIQAGASVSINGAIVEIN